MSKSAQDTPHAESSRRIFLKTSALAVGVMAIHGNVSALQQPPMRLSDKGDEPWTPHPIPEQEPRSEGMVNVDEDVELWYWDTRGDGPAVIFMHAGTGSAASWDYQQPTFAQKGYRVIAYSRRGHYRSSQGREENPGNGADDLDKLLKHLDLDKVHLVAAAHGGNYALDYVLTHPEKILSLTVLSSLMGITDDDYRSVVERIRPKLFSDMPHSFKELGPSYRAGHPHGVFVWEQLVAEAIPGPRIVQKVSQPITWQRLETIKVPTLLMTGDADLYVPPAVLRLQAKHFKQAEVRIIDEAGHSANWERPSEFNELVLGFMDRISGTA